MRQFGCARCSFKPNNAPLNPPPTTTTTDYPELSCGIISNANEAQRVWHRLWHPDLGTSNPTLPKDRA
jgi:hypothetical protein